MNKLYILVLIVLTSTVSCVKSQSKVKEIEQAELKKGIIQDTAFLSFCFSDSLQSFDSKLISLIKSNNVKVDSSGEIIKYVFLTDSVLKNFSVSMKPHFQSNKLTEISFNFMPTLKNHLDNKYTTANQVVQLLINKYGNDSFEDTTSEMAGEPVFRYYWIHDNLKIYLSGQKSDGKLPDLISLRIIDTRKTNQD